MSDIAIKTTGKVFGLSIKDGDLEGDEGLETAVVISLFTDQRVSDDELPVEETSKRGWWADALSEIDQDKIGSKLWLLDRSKRTAETLRKFSDCAMAYGANKALNLIAPDGPETGAAPTQAASANSDFVSQTNNARVDINVNAPPSTKVVGESNGNFMSINRGMAGAF